MNKISKRERKKQLIVRVTCLVLAGLMFLGTAYVALSFLF